MDLELVASRVIMKRDKGPLIVCWARVHKVSVTFKNEGNSELCRKYTSLLLCVLIRFFSLPQKQQHYR